MDKKAFGKRLKAIRNERKLTADKLSEMVGVNPVFIRQIEGGVKLPSLQKLIDLCVSLKIYPNYLLAEDLLFEDNAEMNDILSLFNTLTPKQLRTVYMTLKTLIVNLQSD